MAVEEGEAGLVGGDGAAGSGVVLAVFSCSSMYPPPRNKSLKVFEIKDMSPDLGLTHIAVKCEGPAF